TFTTKFSSLLIEIGLTYDHEDKAVNGTQAMMLLDALPPWLAQKIQEHGRPHDCPHTQWCYGRVVSRAREILAAQVHRPQQPDKRRNYEKQNKPGSFQGPKKFTPLSDTDKDKLKKDGACFYC